MAEVQYEFRVRPPLCSRQPVAFTWTPFTNVIKLKPFEAASLMMFAEEFHVKATGCLQTWLGLPVIDKLWPCSASQLHQALGLA